MAKKSYKEPLDETLEEQVELITEVPPVHFVEDLLADKVLALRAKGYDNNRIAALLGIHVQKIDKI